MNGDKRPIECVHGDRDVADPGAWSRQGLDHERSVQATTYLARRRLVGVVPERPDLVGAEAVDVASAGRYSILGDTGDAVLGVRQIDAVPVDGDALLDASVPQGHLDKIALANPQL